MPNVSNDLSQKLYATMEKHKEVRKLNLIVAIATLPILIILSKYKNMTGSCVMSVITTQLMHVLLYNCCFIYTMAIAEISWKYYLLAADEQWLEQL